MASVIPISSDADARSNLARQLSGRSDRLGRRLARIGGAAAAIFVAIAALFPLDSGAMAPGTEQVENKRKTVQHPDGGIIRQILVREGSVVNAGQPLIALDDNNARNNVSLYHTTNGRRITIKYVDAPVPKNAWHTLRVEFAGSAIKVILNGKTYIDLKDTHITGPGAVGMWTKADSVTAFDDFSYGRAP